MQPDLSTALTLQDLENSKFDVLYRWVYEINGLSDGAIILYTMARNMWELSKQNKWVDEAGRIYFYLTRKSIQEKRNAWSLDKISRLINELDVNIPDNEKVIDIKNSGQCFYAICEKENGKKRVYGWGANNQGSLKQSTDIHTPFVLCDDIDDFDVNNCQQH
ncbi:replication initiator protein A [Campylobacter sp. 7477a]|uniref:replication initiator protein A n=1 Tax=Campylobacter sp. 7477a TaxID=2735741 RepID=UPI003014270C|nr:replication initiator protein A [Campylobacter sp. 7477a]